MHLGFFIITFGSRIARCSNGRVGNSDGKGTQAVGRPTWFCLVIVPLCSAHARANCSKWVHAAHDLALNCVLWTCLYVAGPAALDPVPLTITPCVIFASFLIIFLFYFNTHITTLSSSDSCYTSALVSTTHDTPTTESIRSNTKPWRKTGVPAQRQRLAEMSTLNLDEKPSRTGT